MTTIDAIRHAVSAMDALPEEIYGYVVVFLPVEQEASLRDELAKFIAWRVEERENDQIGRRRIVYGYKGHHERLCVHLLGSEAA